MYSAQNNMRMNSACTYLSRLGYKATYMYVSYSGDTYDLTIEKDGLKYTDRLQNITNKTDEWIHDRIARAVYKIKTAEKEKNKMKNIAFDISRDGPVGKLVIKDNVYDVCVKEVDSYNSPYDTNTVLKVEVSGKNLLEPKCSTRTDGIMAQIEAYKVTTTYNPTRKDSINEGKLQIKDVIFNNPATIVFWSDGSKTVVKAENEIYDPEKGLAMAIAKRALGNQGNYFETFKKYVEPYNAKYISEASELTRIFASIFSGKPIAKVESVKETETGVTVKAELNEPLPEEKKRYRIFYEGENGDINTFIRRTYVRKGNAINAAKKMFAGTTIKWMISNKDIRFISEEWKKQFGSGDK